MFNIIKSLFTPQAIIARLKTMEPLKTIVMDTLFKSRPNHALPIVGSDMIHSVVRAAPVVRRGSPAVAVGGDSRSLAWYEPFPIRIKAPVSAVELNNLKVMGSADRNAWAREKTDFLRNTVRMTAEALATQAISGAVAWPLKIEGGGWDNYEVDWPGMATYSATKKLSAADADLVTALTILRGMKKKLVKNGLGGGLQIWAGSQVYDKLAQMALDHKGTGKFRVELSEAGVNVGGYLVKDRSEVLVNPKDQSEVQVVAPTHLMVLSTTAGHKMPYCAIDDLDGQLRATPFFVKPVKKDDPSTIELIAESKPFPIPNMRGICDCVAV